MAAAIEAQRLKNAYKKQLNDIEGTTNVDFMYRVG
jgi:hypothetical protein